LGVDFRSWAFFDGNGGGLGFGRESGVGFCAGASVTARALSSSVLALLPSLMPRERPLEDSFFLEADEPDGFGSSIFGLSLRSSSLDLSSGLVSFLWISSS